MHQFLEMLNTELLRLQLFGQKMYPNSPRVSHGQQGLDLCFDIFFSQFFYLLPQAWIGKSPLLQAVHTSEHSKSGVLRLHTQNQEAYYPRQGGIVFPLLLIARNPSDEHLCPPCFLSLKNSFQIFFGFDMFFGLQILLISYIFPDNL